MKAGDKMSASLASVKGTNEFELVLIDTTQTWTRLHLLRIPSGRGRFAVGAVPSAGRPHHCSPTSGSTGT